GEHALPDQDHGRPDREPAVELDGERVHRDGPDRRPELACDADLRAGQVAAEAVCVADGDDPDPGRLLRDVAAAVTRALAGLEEPDGRELAAPRENRLQAVLR